jgi:hypothetical protein
MPQQHVGEADTDDELKHDAEGKNLNILITASYRTI